MLVDSEEVFLLYNSFCIDLNYFLYLKVLVPDEWRFIRFGCDMSYCALILKYHLS